MSLCRKCCVAMVLIVFVNSSPWASELVAPAAPITATWIGGGGNNAWSNPANWDVAVSPCNIGTVEFNVIIPGGSGTIDHDVVGSCEIKTLELGVNRSLVINAGASLTVLETAVIREEI